ncbi:hypothetical protein K435DRAFT_804903 [Dendrothele bispora CBS 962.96]|uniref:Uncharacterized protein n=1 Tax=Dendrothele bispora (strain CBS 962.96) TaxID=1314807 RepID=A0A4S8LDH0_DENBC|nr:hypothetical protein K435DRAFT_804903 [Dendrothele bispora CBS 962.96]
MSKDAATPKETPAAKDYPKPKQKAKSTAPVIEEYSPIRKPKEPAPLTFQKPRGVKRQMEVEISTTPESTAGKKKPEAARPAKKAKTSTTEPEPKKGILKKTSTVAEPRTRRQHSRARSAAPSEAEQEEEDEEESRSAARTIKLKKGKNRARTPAVNIHTGTGTKTGRIQMPRTSGSTDSDGSQMRMGL